MSASGLSRAALVDALDELGEREHLADVWTVNADGPYPPEAVRKRAKRLRWQLRWRRGAFLVLMILVGVTGGLGTAGWTVPGVLFGFLFGFGIGFVIASLFADPWAEDQMQALRLYDLLEQLDENADVA